MNPTIKIEFLTDTYEPANGTAYAVFQGNTDQCEAIMTALNNTGDFEAQVME